MGTDREFEATKAKLEREGWKQLPCARHDKDPDYEYRYETDNSLFTNATNVGETYVCFERKKQKTFSGEIKSIEINLTKEQEDKIVERTINGVIDGIRRRWSY